MHSDGMLRLQAWLSPAFPTGAYAYSHALEMAVEDSAVRDRDTLVDWLEADLRFGSVRNDAILFALAYRAALRLGPRVFRAIATLAAAMRGTAELALESGAQGAAFLSTVRIAWPNQRLDALAKGITPTLPVAVAACVATHGIALADALPLYVQSTVANLVNAGVRLIPLGQSDGQRAIAALEPAVIEIAREAERARIGDLGSAAFMIDIASARHETQYTRLFRS